MTLKKLIRRWLLKRDIEAFSEKHSQDKTFVLNGVGTHYTKALFSPLTVIVRIMEDVYGTLSLPVSGITTDITTLDLTTGKVPSVIIYTSQPGVLLESSKAKYYEMKRALCNAFNVADVNISYKDVEDIHVVDY